MVGGPRKCPQRQEAKRKEVWEWFWSLCPMHTHGTWGMNPVQTGPGMGASERVQANLHSTPRTKSFGGHEAPDARSPQSTGVLTVPL